MCGLAYVVEDKEAFIPKVRNLSTIAKPDYIIKKNEHEKII